MGILFMEAKAIVKVNLDNSIVSQGEMLTGIIDIKPNKNKDITKLHNPKIDFSILQEQNWQSYIFSQEEKKTRNEGYNNSYHSTQTLNFQEYKDKNFSQGIAIPFQYKIPEDITPSLEWPQTRYEFASIRNFLIVNIPELSYKTKILLIILKKPCKDIFPLKVIQKEERKKLLLFGTGSIIIESSYPKFSFPILGEIQLTVKVDASNSDVLIKDITVKLKRRLEFFAKDNSISTRSILQNMYVESRKVSYKTEEIIFFIPFKDSNNIDYYLKCSPLGENVEMCCLIPNVDTNTIRVNYYIKVIANPDDLLAKKIELKMPVDFISKDDNLNKTIYDNFNDKVKKINSGDANLNYMDPYLNNQYQMQNNSQNEFNIPPSQYQNYGQNNYNNNPNDGYYAPNLPPNTTENNNNNYYPNNQNMNNNMNNNQAEFPEPSKEYLDDLPSLEEIEKQEKNKENNISNNQYPEI